MVGCEVDDAHHAQAASHTHVFLHTVGRAFVDGYEVVELVEGVAHHARRYRLISCEHASLQALKIGCVVSQRGLCLCHLRHLSLKIQVTRRQLAVDLDEREILVHGCLGSINLSRHRIGRREPHASLIAVILEQQHKADNLKKQEQNPVVVTCKKIEKITHSVY